MASDANLTGLGHRVRGIVKNRPRQAVRQAVWWMKSLGSRGPKTSNVAFALVVRQFTHDLLSALPMGAPRRAGTGFNATQRENAALRICRSF